MVIISKVLTCLFFSVIKTKLENSHVSDPMDCCNWNKYFVLFCSNCLYRSTIFVINLPPSAHNGYCAKISIQFNGGKLGVLTGAGEQFWMAIFC